MKLLHTSPTEITKITKFGTFGDCLCFSNDRYLMSECEVITYSIELSEDDVIDAHTFFYRDDYEMLNAIIEDVMSLADCDEDEAQELLAQNDNHSDAEIDWRIQGYTGAAAKVLGFKAARAQDEQGDVFLVPMFGNENILTAL